MRKRLTGLAARPYAGVNAETILFQRETGESVILS